MPCDQVGSEGAMQWKTLHSTEKLVRRICWLPRIPPCSTLGLGFDSQPFSGFNLIVGPQGSGIPGQQVV